jgi:formylglycine-generating enzyme required for sulfatase activity
LVESTNYVTVAERPLSPEDYPDALPELLEPGSLVFQKPAGRVSLNTYQNWWAYVPGANWRHQEGPGSSLAGRKQHPVVHNAYEEAQAYAQWSGKALPSEAQWEYAARGGLQGAIYTWGDEFAPQRRMMANTWHGEFPWQNLLSDGDARTAPVGSFPSNGYGLYDMAGNVWEWTSDWYSERQQTTKPCCLPVDPRGASLEQSYDPAQPEVHIPRKVLKGSSFLCAPNYCLRYRPAAGIPQMIESATCHIGFRCVITR